MASVAKREWKGTKGEDLSAWVVRYTDEKGKRRLKTFDKKKDADRYRMQIENEIEAGVHVADADAISFKVAADLWMRDGERRNKETGAPTASTLKTFEWALRMHLLPLFGSVKINVLSAESVQAFLDARTMTTPYDTLRCFRLILTQVIQFCVRTKRLKRNVIRDEKVKLPGRAKRVVLPSKADIEALLEVLRERSKGEQVLAFLQRRAFVSLALFGGMRMGEICALKWEQVHFDRSLIEVRHSFSRLNGLKGPKTEAGVRDVPMVRPVREALQELFAHTRNKAEGFCFLTKTGAPFYTATVHAIIWKPLLERAGLIDPPRGAKTRHGRPKFHFHSLRHAAVSLLIAEGLPSVNIARFVGHSSATTTLMIYGHLFPEDRRVAEGLAGISDKMGATWAQHRPVTY